MKLDALTTGIGVVSAKSLVFLLLLVCLSTTVSSQETAGKKFFFAFEDNRIFSEQELAQNINQCINNNRGKSSDSEVLDYCSEQLKRLISSKGYLKAIVVKKRHENLEDGIRIVLRVQEGLLYRLGHVTIIGATHLTSSAAREMLTLNEGDVANTDRLTEWTGKALKDAYGEFGYLQFTAMVEPTYHSRTGEAEGTVDLSVTIDEGQVFTMKSIRFVGEGNINQDELCQGLFVRAGEVFNKKLFDDSIKTLNQRGLFQPIDPDRDVDYQWDQKSPQVDVIIHLKKNARL